MTNNNIRTYDISKVSLMINGVDIMGYAVDDVLIINSNKDDEDMKNFKSCLTGLSPKGKVIEDDKSFMKLLYNWSDEYIDKLYKRYMDELKSNRKIYDYSKENKRKWRNQ